MNKNDSTRERSKSGESEDLRLLVIGSVRPNIEDGDNAGIRIRAILENSDDAVENYDAVIHTGFVRPTPHHERLSPGAFFDELNDQLGAIAHEAPVYYVSGDIGFGDPLGTIYERRQYAPNERREPLVDAPSESFEYIPIQGHTNLGEFVLTQNPRIAAQTEQSILVTPDLYPELWNNHDATVHLVGGQLTGRWIADSLAPSYAVENVGPMRPDSAGAVHTISVDTDGINSHQYVPLGDIELVSCDKHLDRGLQYVHEGNGCIFCNNENQYFEEWLCAGSRATRVDCSDHTRAAVVNAAKEMAHFLPDQAEDFEGYVEKRGVADGLSVARNEVATNPTRSPDSSLIPDPRDVYDQATLLAGEQLRLEPYERAEYFDRFDVTDVSRLRERYEFEDVRPPTPGEIDDDHVRMDEAAFERGILQGEWLVFPKARTIGAVWQELLELVHQGVLYDGQVSTAWHKNQRNDKSRRHYVGIAVPNYFDYEDVLRVGKLITEVDIVEDDSMFFFKPLLYTRLGINRWNAREYGLEQSSRFRLSDLLQMDED